uniref:Uncharacterized protein n=1 Tax=Glossina brevipalpis TaxID=37001 RepID=A0A1A9WAA3_9MUSC
METHAHGVLLIIAAYMLHNSFVTAVVMPYEVLNNNVNALKPKDYNHHKPLSLSMDVNVPTSTDEAFTVVPSNNYNRYGAKTEIPSLQYMAENQRHKVSYRRSQRQQQQQHHQQQQQEQKHKSSRNYHSNKASGTTLKRCSIEVISKMLGFCQPVGAIGNACISGDYIDVFNAKQLEWLEWKQSF